MCARGAGFLEGALPPASYPIHLLTGFKGQEEAGEEM